MVIEDGTVLVAVIRINTQPHSPPFPDRNLPFEVLSRASWSMPMASSPSPSPSASASASASESTTLLSEDAGASGALEAGGAIDIYDRRRIGYLAQYFAVGIISSGLPATQYGLFVCYLNVPAYVASAAGTLAMFPWSLKIIFALTTDTLPIGGYRRRPYMVIGWMFCAVFLLLLACVPLPEPYFCRTPDGVYSLTKVCNEAAAARACHLRSSCSSSRSATCRPTWPPMRSQCSTRGGSRSRSVGRRERHTSCASAA